MHRPSALEIAVFRTPPAAGFFPLVLCCAVLACWRPQRSPAQEPAPATIEAAISRLADGHFAAREKATEDLVRLGAQALPALDAAAASPDREVRMRATRIAASIRQADFDRRLEEFASGSRPPSDADVPGWESYSGVVGDSAPARSLFVEMHREDAELMSAAHNRPEEAKRLLAQRLKEAGQSLQSPDEPASLAAVAALLWTASRQQVVLEEEASATLLALCHQSNVKSTLAGDHASEPMRKLLGAVIRRAEGREAYPAMAMSLQFSIEEGLSPAARVIKQGVGHAQLLQYAILTIARFGDDQHLPLLESLFTNDDRCAGMRIDDVEHIAQVRDLALAAALHLAGEDLEQYGYKVVQSEAQTVFAPASLGFASEGDRAAAFARWAGWRRSRPSPSAR